MSRVVFINLLLMKRGGPSGFTIYTQKKCQFLKHNTSVRSLILEQKIISIATKENWNFGEHELAN